MKKKGRIRIRTCNQRIRMRIREAQKHADPDPDADPDADADPEHWFQYLFSRMLVESTVLLLIFVNNIRVTP